MASLKLWLRAILEKKKDENGDPRSAGSKIRSEVKAKRWEMLVAFLILLIEIVDVL